jgi:hypothetical protein
MKKQYLGRIAWLAAALAIGIGASTNACASLTLFVGPGGTVADRVLGEEVPQQFGGGLVVRDVNTVNALLGMSLGQRTSTDYRSLANFGTLPVATTTGAVFAGGFGSMTLSGAQWISITLPTTTTFQYLVGAWDGPNGGVEVWNIAGVVGGTEILIPRYAQPVAVTGGMDLVQDTGQYQITTWSMLNPTPVPEPTTMFAGALLLLPFAVSALRVIRKNRKA